MNDSQNLLNLKEVSQLLKINPEVLRRWLRNGKLKGIKVGSDWRVYYSDLRIFLNGPLPVSSESNAPQTLDNAPKMCIRFPKWLEFSGLPLYFNETYGPETWPIFKKLIELDFEAGKPVDRKIKLNIPEISEMVGYDQDIVDNLIRALSQSGYITITKEKSASYFSIVTPIRTPKIILDIEYSKGGVKGAPESALDNACLRRFLEI